MSLWHVYWLQSNDAAADQTLAFAASELARYAQLITDQSCAVTPVRTVAQAPVEPGTALLGLCGQMALAKEIELTPALWDDGYAIWTSGDQLRLAGRNARSVLYAAYDFLQRQGVRFVRPGPDGERIPAQPKLALPTEPIVENAAYRHRGVCIEGAPSLEHCLNMVDWCAKRRMNTLFLQFFSSRYYFQLWYGRPYNPQFADHDVDDQEAARLDHEVVEALRQRDLVYHQVGHGWTALTLDMPRSGWVTTEEEVPEARRRWAAEVDGTRGLFKGTPINTELCYSYQPAFDALIENIVTYCAAHPEMDVVHFWLSDAYNNKCECDACQELSITDWYAKLINALSVALHQRTPGKRFVFLCYFELLWPPEKVQIDDRYDNIIMMYAPISRCYGHKLTDGACDDNADYARPPLNRFVSPRVNRFFAQDIADWRQSFGGDSFDFDYHLTWAIWRQLDDTYLARMIYEDLQDLQAIGLNGILSCQSFRAFWPTGLAMHVLADGLWDPMEPWAVMAERFFQDAYGAQAQQAIDYVNETQDILATDDPHRRALPFSTSDAAQLAQKLAQLEEALQMLEQAQDGADAMADRSLDILAYQVRILQRIIPIYQAHVDGNAAGARRAWELACDYIRDTEPHYHDVFDTRFMIERSMPNVLDVITPKESH